MTQISTTPIINNSDTSKYDNSARLPYIVIPNIDEKIHIRWEKQFVQTGRDTEIEMWRREDDLYTHVNFGVDISSQRRRLLQFSYKYDLVTRETGQVDLAITHTSIYLNTALTKKECLRGYNIQIAS